MAVDLILLEDVKGLGTMGEQVKVKDGYARNFLLPKEKAMRATADAVRRLEARRAKLQAEEEARKVAAEQMAETLGRMSVTLTVEAGDDDKLYGSVGPQQVAEALQENGAKVERKQVQMDEPIRQLGVYSVDVSLHPEVQATVKVWVVRA